MPFHVSVENLIHNLRYKQVLPHIKKCHTLVDLGSGDVPRFLRKAHDLADECLGFDANATPHTDGNIRIEKGDITAPLALENDSVDQMTILAVIEHIEGPVSVLKECLRCLKKGGRLVVTTPTQIGIHAREVLRFIRDLEEGEHKDFAMSKTLLSGWAKKAGFKIETIYTFEMGMNPIMVCEKS